MRIDTDDEERTRLGRSDLRMLSERGSGMESDSDVSLEESPSPEIGEFINDDQMPSTDQRPDNLESLNAIVPEFLPSVGFIPQRRIKTLIMK